MAFVASAFASSMLIDSTAGQIETYDDKYAELSGTAASLHNLPMGIRQIAILFFSQLPLDSFHYLSVAASFSNLYLAVLSILFKIFGFVAFYGLLYYCFIKGFFKKLDLNEKLLVIIMLVFVAITLSTHIDVRRSMEAVPIFYLFYLMLAERYYREKMRKVNGTLVAVGCLIMIAYAIVK